MEFFDDKREGGSRERERELDFQGCRPLSLHKCPTQAFFGRRVDPCRPNSGAAAAKEVSYPPFRLLF